MEYKSKFKSGRGLLDKWANGAEGVKTAFKLEPVLFLQIFTGVLAIIIALIIGRHWWFIKQTIFMTIAVLLMEILNTSFEYLCDLVEPSKNRRVKKIKDMLAGMVLITGITAIVITIIDLVNFFR